MDTVRVAVSHYGVVGKWVADAVRLQPDMELVGVAEDATDRLRVAAVLGIPVYSATADAADAMRDAGLAVAGDLDDLLARVDAVVDCGPKHVGAASLPRYRAAGVKAVLQGGENHAATGHSFVAQANYASAVGRDATRVVSCNTVGIVRVLGALRDAGLLARARGVLVRRAPEPWESQLGGAMNTVLPEPAIPSHHGPDTQTVLPDLDVVTIAAKAAHIQTHTHYWVLELTREAGRGEVLDALRAAPRIAFIRMGDGPPALDTSVEVMRGLGRPRTAWEVAVWADALAVGGAEAYVACQVYNKAIVVPESIDAVRALTGIVADGAESIRRTDDTLGMRAGFRDAPALAPR